MSYNISTSSLHKQHCHQQKPHDNTDILRIKAEYELKLQQLHKEITGLMEQHHMADIETLAKEETLNSGFAQLLETISQAVNTLQSHINYNNNTQLNQLTLLIKNSLQQTKNEIINQLQSQIIQSETNIKQQLDDIYLFINTQSNEVLDSLNKLSNDFIAIIDGAKHEIITQLAYEIQHRNPDNSNHNDIATPDDIVALFPDDQLTDDQLTLS